MMPCYSPLHGYQSRKVTANGKRKIVFSKNSGFIDKPITVPCGACIGCRIDRSRMWAIRCVHEAKLHLENCFVTLTYDDEHCPADYGLRKSDLQLFFKRLRNHGFEVRYFACGEYGDEYKRPHYHAIIFGSSFTADRKKHSVKKARKLEYNVYISETLTRIWGMGRVTFSDFHYSNAAYTARYVMKKQTGKNAIDHDSYTRLNQDGELYQVSPEFALMSRNPGLGSGWYDKYSSDAFPSDFLIHEGKRHPVPRFYLDKLTKEKEVMSKTIKTKRKKARLETLSDNTPDRLHVREQVKKSQISQLKRSL